ncbi:hypothetical protein DMC47_10770 [Nostoc sp. 3335mG]|nr:hypothetical protein DMC47_10770 [Nostoc sp. 3335mG]
MSKDTLIKSAYKQDVVANNKVDTYYGDDFNTAFVVATGDVGDDIIKYFGRDDSIITNKKIFDGNGDGIINFGKDGVLDIDRINVRKAGNDQLSLSYGDAKIGALRYLGEMNGQHAYADAQTALNFVEHFGPGYESSIGDETFSTEGGSFLFDNMLGLNLGNDMIEGAVTSVNIVTTFALGSEDIYSSVNPSDKWMKDGEAYTVFSLSAPSGSGGDSVGSITFKGEYGGFLTLREIQQDADGQNFYVYNLVTP